MQHWLGHSDPALTLRTYIGLLDGDVGGPLDLAAVQTQPSPPSPLVVDVA